MPPLQLVAYDVEELERFVLEALCTLRHPFSFVAAEECYTARQCFEALAAQVRTSARREHSDAGEGAPDASILPDIYASRAAAPHVPCERATQFLRVVATSLRPAQRTHFLVRASCRTLGAACSPGSLNRAGGAR